jgi:hypothetical protein
MAIPGNALAPILLWRIAPATSGSRRGKTQKLPHAHLTAKGPDGYTAGNPATKNEGSRSPQQKPSSVG